MERAKQRLSVVVPVTLAIIMLLLYLSFRRFGEVFVIMGTLPLAMVGGLWLMHYLNYNFSIAVGVGFIALAGVAVEIGVIMLVYLNQAWHAAKLSAQESNKKVTPEMLTDAIRQGAGLRVRPVMMTVLTVIIGLIPIMYGSGTGSEVMQRIAAPMIGGMASALLLTLLVLPAIFKLWKSKETQ
jgi:Cu(I)/Ag(I) efflux system membrane protein CusA/SilA